MVLPAAADMEETPTAPARRDILYLTHEEAEPRLLRWMALPFGIQLFHPRTSESPEEAAHRAALVLLDLSVFASVRSRTLRRLRLAHPDLPIIAVFDRFDGRAVALAIQDGASDYLTRPLDFTRWWAKITPLIEGQAPPPDFSYAAPAAPPAPPELRLGTHLDVWT